MKTNTSLLGSEQPQPLIVHGAAISPGFAQGVVHLQFSLLGPIDVPGNNAQHNVEKEFHRLDGYRKYKPPFCPSGESSYPKSSHSFTVQVQILTIGPAGPARIALIFFGLAIKSLTDGSLDVSCSTGRNETTRYTDMYDLILDRKGRKQDSREAMYNLCLDRRVVERRHMNIDSKRKFDRRDVNRRVDTRPLNEFPYIP